MNIPQIAPPQCAEWLDRAQAQGHTPVLLDVREPWERQLAQITPAGARVLWIPMGEIAGRALGLAADVPVLCLCHHGIRSQRVAQFLAGQGYTQVANLSGGIDAWSETVDSMVPRY